MVSWAAKKAKDAAAKKTKAHENRNLDGTYYSNAEKEDVHREEKIVITEERTKHLNDLKQQILERNSKLSEIERRAFAEAHTPKKKKLHGRREEVTGVLGVDGPPLHGPARRITKVGARSEGGAGGDH